MISNNEAAFVPKDNIPISLGKSTVYLYPSITPEMTYHEKTFGFMVTKSALEAADVPIKTKLQVLGDNLGCTALVGIMEVIYLKYAKEFIH